MSEVKVVGKISMSTIGAKARNVLGESYAAPGAFCRLAVVMGIANGLKIIIDKNKGESYEAITGQFEATTLESGDVFQSGVLYLPSGIHETVLSAVKTLETDKDAIRFALEIRSVRATNLAGYSYQAVKLMAPETVDPLEEVRKLIAAHAGPAQIEAGGDDEKRVDLSKIATKGKK